MGDHIRIQKCGQDEIEEMQRFFGREWNENHVFAMSRKYVDWNFSDRNGYNVIYARDLDCDEIVGILCYIPNSHFDSAIPPEDQFIWITNWLVKKEGYNGLGLRLLMALMKIEGTRRIGTVGNNDLAMEIYQALRFRTGTLTHYFMVNRETLEFGILGGYVKGEQRVCECSSLILQRVERLDSAADSLVEFMESVYPRKSLRYLENKYLRDPFYEYHIYGIAEPNDGSYLAFFVCRVVSHGQNKAVRVVEYLGEPRFLFGLYEELQGLLCRYEAEYLDFYCGGLSQEDEEGLLRAGFEVNQAEGELVVPSYFEPYLHQNIRISFAYHMMSEHTLIFKGDCDRDHPRVL